MDGLVPAPSSLTLVPCCRSALAPSSPPLLPLAPPLACGGLASLPTALVAAAAAPASSLLLSLLLWSTTAPTTAGCHRRCLCSSRAGGSGSGARMLFQGISRGTARVVAGACTGRLLLRLHRPPGPVAGEVTAMTSAPAWGAWIAGWSLGPPRSQLAGPAPCLAQCPTVWRLSSP